MQRTPQEQQYAAPAEAIAIDKQGTENHRAQFTPARDSRNRRIAGLYIRTAFTFDNIPTDQAKADALRSCDNCSRIVMRIKGRKNTGRNNGDGSKTATRLATRRSAPAAS